MVVGEGSPSGDFGQVVLTPDEHTGVRVLDTETARGNDSGTEHCDQLNNHTPISRLHTYLCLR